jgi:chemotaxis protein methyltransferase CheR
MAIPNFCTADYTEFKSLVLRKTGIDLDLYKHQQMHRRLLSMVDRAHVRSFLEYFDLLERDGRELTTFLDRLTINVSEFFRNPEKWNELKREVLPPLLARQPRLKIWSAGCSNGAEPYSLAILLAQLEAPPGQTIHATDLDLTALDRAREATYTLNDLRSLDHEGLRLYFDRLAPAGNAAGHPEPIASFQVKPAVRARVAFTHHNLLGDSFETDYDLICCRNVVIYFTDAAKDRLFEQFYRSLAPGGILFLGGTERIFRYKEIGFESLGPFFYRRPL